jgi:hypothetical protein
MTRKLSILVTAAAAVAAVAVPIAALAASSHHTANAVTVTLKEFSITMPKKLKAGPTTFTVTNKGKFPHDIRVAYHQAGTPTFKTAPIKPGATVKVSTNLKPGGYVVVCAEGGGYHASQGMIHTFTVGTFSFTTFKWGP